MSSAAARARDLWRYTGIERPIQRLSAPADVPTVAGPSTAATDSYVAARQRWRELSAAECGAEIAEQVAAAREYVRAIDAYIAGMRHAGQPIPRHLEVLAAALRANYGDQPAPPSS
jgi:transglutaminase-like putative cysteine protease